MVITINVGRAKQDVCHGWAGRKDEDDGAEQVTKGTCNKREKSQRSEDRL